MSTFFSKTGHNRRSISRIPFQLPVHFFTQNGSGQQYEGMSVNLHYRGAEITTDVKISRGSPVRIRLPQSVTGHRTPATTGEVRWARNTHGRYSYGIFFKEDFHWVFTLTKETLTALQSDKNASVAEFVLNSINDGVFSVNRKWQITSFN